MFWRTAAYNTLVAKMGDHEKELVTLCAEPDGTTEKVGEFGSTGALDTMTTAHLATVVMDHRSDNSFATIVNGKLRRGFTNAR